MIAVAQWSADDRRDLFREASNRSGLSFDVIQKDFWVCFILDQLFSHPKIGQTVYFKGGTSLSKCFQVIERFSEDIDLTVDRSALGFDSDELATAPTKSQLKKRRKSIKAAGFEYASTHIFPALQSAITDILPDANSWQLIDAGDGVINFTFPADADLSTGTYLRPDVRLEIGGLSDLEPNETKRVSPYAAEVSEPFDRHETQVQVVLARRTLCDKLLLLHRLNTSGTDLPAEHSRHFYDVAMMVGSAVRREFLDDPELLPHAIAYEGRTFPRAGIDYDALLPSDLRLSPPEELMPSLRKDYEDMREMFFSEPPALASIIKALEELESDLGPRSNDRER